MMWDGRNRRKFPRVAFPCLIKIRNAQGQNDARLSHTENLSVGGARVILKQVVKFGSTIEVEIDLLDADEPLHCAGKVVWSEQRKEEESFKPLFYDIGIEFIKVSSADHKRLEAVIGHYLKQNKQV